MLKFEVLRAVRRPVSPCICGARPQLPGEHSPFAVCAARPEGRARGAARLYRIPQPRPRMLPKLLTSIFGSRNDRLLKQYRQVVAKVKSSKLRSKP